MYLITVINSIVILVLLVMALKTLRGTTLVAPIWWCMLSIGSIALCELHLSTGESEWAAQLRYIVATSTLCPGVAVLGAKRPQDSGWKFIVSSLWFVMMLPAIQATLFGRGTHLELHWAWQYFLLLLLLACWSNYLLTKFWFAACLTLAGQIIMFGTHVPGIQFEANSQSIAIGMTIAAVASLLVYFQSRTSARNGIDRVWIDFRNVFGAVWGLRIMERVNATGSLQSWSRTLMWSGFEAVQESPGQTSTGKTSPAKSREENNQIEQTIRTLLRRFVDDDWISRRIRDGERVR